MPVRFRCSGCRAKLSIACRKVGLSIACPKCAAAVTVPSEEFANEWVVRKKGKPSVNGGTSVRTPSPAPTTTGINLVSASPDLDDLPLFERFDFTQIAESVEKAEPPKPKPHPEAPPAPPHPDGILVRRSTATVLAAAFVVLIGLAFVAGFLVGSK